jgi:hypothetical protein
VLTINFGGMVERPVIKKTAPTNSHFGCFWSEADIEERNGSVRVPGKRTE